MAFALGASVFVEAFSTWNHAERRRKLRTAHMSTTHPVVLFSEKMHGTRVAWDFSYRDEKKKRC